MFPQLRTVKSKYVPVSSRHYGEQLDLHYVSVKPTLLSILKLVLSFGKILTWFVIRL